MKPFKLKDIIVLGCAILAIGGSIYFLLSISAPKKKKNTTSKSAADKVVKINPDIDENTYKQITSLKDYKKPTLENIGKKDIFSPIEIIVIVPVQE